MSTTPSRADALLDFWFADKQAKRWFAKSAAFDEQIRARFGAEVQAAAEGRLDAWADTPRGWLALLILLDQFPRNLYRDDPRAWAQDVSAQRLALSGIAEGFDRQLPPLQRGFAYMPLEHAENEGLQQRSVALFEALYAEVTPAERPRFRSSLNYARRHREVIARFGRFPHRNAVLGRPSTEEELHYLAQPGAGF
ncbi:MULTISPECIES: DUF924 family protein [Rhodanobacter]|jgi:uncharacterized protein (DUF924 family)|uniref:Uncharacterized conserved protein, DUF924 family n=1 Tax=Rhodanobacter glycinis TaxID=582702 RepID=A0A1I4AK07_9GAMM|nr:MULTISPECIES: DUF924 family protein [Rhodanobacter]EIL97540.1 hypothetical protein UU5_04861 [Rhodanobacter sp. 115]SFK56825.1 Uncharacterized conserved protein, DUF924 family [Rhodanobacter glycinis]